MNSSDFTNHIDCRECGATLPLRSNKTYVEYTCSVCGLVNGASDLVDTLNIPAPKTAEMLFAKPTRSLLKMYGKAGRSRALLRAEALIGQICKQIGCNGMMESSATELLKQIADISQYRRATSNTKNMLAAISMYVTCRKNNWPMTLSDMSSFVGQDVFKFGSLFNEITKIFPNLKVPTSDLFEILNRYCMQFGYSEILRNYVFNLYDIVCTAWLDSIGTPKPMATCICYVAWFMDKRHQTKYLSVKQFSAKFRVPAPNGFQRIFCRLMTLLNCLAAEIADFEDTSYLGGLKKLWLPCRYLDIIVENKEALFKAAVLRHLRQRQSDFVERNNAVRHNDVIVEDNTYDAKNVDLESSIEVKVDENNNVGGSSICQNKVQMNTSIISDDMSNKISGGVASKNVGSENVKGIDRHDVGRIDVVDITDLDVDCENNRVIDGRDVIYRKGVTRKDIGHIDIVNITDIDVDCKNNGRDTRMDVQRSVVRLTRSVQLQSQHSRQDELNANSGSVADKGRGVYSENSIDSRDVSSANSGNVARGDIVDITNDDVDRGNNENDTLMDVEHSLIRFADDSRSRWNHRGVSVRPPNQPSKRGGPAVKQNQFATFTRSDYEQFLMRRNSGVHFKIPFDSAYPWMPFYASKKKKVGMEMPVDAAVAEMIARKTLMNAADIDNLNDSDLDEDILQYIRTDEEVENLRSNKRFFK